MVTIIDIFPFTDLIVRGDRTELAFKRKLSQPTRAIFAELIRASKDDFVMSPSFPNFEEPLAEHMREEYGGRTMKEDIKINFNEELIY